MMNLGAMYLRPGNLWKSFRVKRKLTYNHYGTVKEEYEDTDLAVLGILAEANDSQNERYKHMWDQTQHSLTHTMVVRGKAPLMKMDLLTCDERAFLVLYNDDVGALGLAGLIYLEERNDIK